MATNCLLQYSTTQAQGWPIEGALLCPDMKLVKVGTDYWRLEVIRRSSGLLSKPHEADAKTTCLFEVDVGSASRHVLPSTVP